MNHFRQIQAAVDARLGRIRSPRDISNDVHLAPETIRKTVRREYGVPFGRYLRIRRVEWMKEELASTERPCINIALDAGFAHESHACRVFKEETGTTMREYRELARDSMTGNARKG